MFTGKLESKIKSTCRVGAVRPSPVNLAKANEEVGRCFKLLNMYCQLSLTRQIMLAQLSGLSNERGAENLKEGFMNLIKQAQTTDHDVLGFLARPMWNPGARFTIYKLYANQIHYPVIVEYLKRLDVRDQVLAKTKDSVEIRVNFNKDNAMFCAEEYLQGNCRLIKKVSVKCQFDYFKFSKLYLKLFLLNAGLLSL